MTMICPGAYSLLVWMPLLLTAGSICALLWMIWSDTVRTSRVGARTSRYRLTASPREENGHRWVRMLLS